MTVSYRRLTLEQDSGGGGCMYTVFLFLAYEGVSVLLYTAPPLLVKVPSGLLPIPLGTADLL